jgi:HEAT repeat protein
MSTANALRLILLLTGAAALPLRATAAEPKADAATKPAASKPDAKALTPGPSPAAGEGSASRSAAKTSDETIVWLQSLNDGYRRALAGRKPILIRVGAKWSDACRRLAKNIETPEVQAELARWTPVYLDFDAQAEDVAELGVGGAPAMHIRTPAGQHVAERDGYATADELIEWLKKNYDAATASADDVLLASGEPSATAAVRLVKQFQQRNPALREAAIRRLLPYPNAARSAVLRAFTEGSLTSRLAAFEVLEQWKAPLAGLDPWRPETFTTKRLAQLEKWKLRAIAVQEEAKQLSKEQLAAARKQIERMLAADESEADAIRQRLARFGSPLLPEVYARLKDAAADQDRRRLLILRYRLAACDALVLRWSGGIERLGDTDPRQRRQAADELAKMAGEEEKPLLLELFADSDPLVREISLRGLQHIGGREAKAALVKLLSDPEPNVRAAVLKQLEESPEAAMVPAVVKYLKDEKDSDLVVHGIGFLRAAKGAEATRCLMSLLKHKSWQVRAEAAAGIGKLNDRTVVHYSSTPFGAATETDPAAKLQADAYVALLDLLDDEDGFVVAKAVEGLSEADLPAAVEPLVKVATKHPELAAGVLTMIAGKNNMRQKAIPQLRKFCKDQKPPVRAAAIAALCCATNDVADEMTVALSDKESDVRVAAAGALFKSMEQLREAEKNTARNAAISRMTTSSSVVVEVDTTDVADSVASAVAKFFGGGAGKPAPVKKPAKKTSTEKKPEKKADEKADGSKKPRAAQNAENAKNAKATPEAAKKGKADAEKKPEAKKPDEEVNPKDQWLLDFYAGKGRPKWTRQMVAPLEQMLKAADSKERIAAALAIVPLGKADAALPVILDAVRGKHEQVESVAELLPWLVWKQRIKTFRELWSLIGYGDLGPHLIAALAEAPDRRAAEPLWELLANRKVSEFEAFAIHSALMVAYFGQEYYSSSEMPASDRRDLAKAAKPRTEAGNELQRLVALALLAVAAGDDAAAAAARMGDDSKLSDSLRTDAFQIELLARSAPDARKLALAAMKGTNAGRKKLALVYLIHGAGELGFLHQGIYLYSLANTTDSSSSSGTPIVPKPPEGVTLEDVRPLMSHADAQVAASAGYLAALLGDPAGLTPLLSHWRQRGEYSGDWKKLVYRAIAVVDDPKYIPVLREIYGKLEDYEMSEFYWTIRIMSGSEILTFRKEIRDKVGASKLGQ